MIRKELKSGAHYRLLHADMGAIRPPYPQGSVHSAKLADQAGR